MAGRGILPVGALLLSLGAGSLAVSVLEGSDGEHAEAFHAFIKKYDRRYEVGSEEYHNRLALFASSRSEVAAHNAQTDRLWTAGVNALADRSEEELSRLRGWRGGFVPRSAPGPSGLLQQSGSSGRLLRPKARRKMPEQFLDWSKLKAAKSTTDQGGCGSCWALASSEVLRMHMEIYNPRSNRTFSAQELVSCVPNPHRCGGSGGCGGATVELAMLWTQYEGLAQEHDQPYEGEGVDCNKPGRRKRALLQIKGQDDFLASEARVGVHKAPAGSPSRAFGLVAFERLPENKYGALLRAVSERGPVAVSMAARSWSFYDSGVFDGCRKEWVIDHAVVLVGYGTDDSSGKDFYLIQNSWGSGWGENGRIRVLRSAGEQGNCGMDRQPEVGTGCKGGPKAVRVCGACGILYDSVVPHFRRV